MKVYKALLGHVAELMSMNIHSEDTRHLESCVISTIAVIPRQDFINCLSMCGTNKCGNVSHKHSH